MIGLKILSVRRVIRMIRKGLVAFGAVVLSMSVSPAMAEDGSLATSSATAKKTKKKGKAKKKGDVPACDKRKSVSDTSKNPGPAVTQLRYVNDDGSLGAWASGSLISPHTVLTCGHCVFNGKKKTYNQRPMAIMPGAYKSALNRLVKPFGDYRLTNVNTHKRTNRKYREGKKGKGNYDYGAMYVVCPFEHLKTYAPLAFKSPKSQFASPVTPSKACPTPSRAAIRLPALVR